MRSNVADNNSKPTISPKKGYHNKENTKPNVLECGNEINSVAPAQSLGYLYL